MTKNISEDTKAEVAPTREMLESYGTKVYVNDEISESCWTFQNKTWLVNSDDTITRLATEADFDAQAATSELVG